MLVLYRGVRFDCVSLTTLGPSKRIFRKWKEVLAHCIATATHSTTSMTDQRHDNGGFEG